MEVPGKKLDTSESGESSGSSQYLRCQPCSADGEDLKANGFCQNCQEYLCSTCIRYHRKATLSKQYVILDKDRMPKNVVPQAVKQLCTETCEKHVLEVIKFFCKDHDMVGCGTCMVLDHKSCNVDFIPDIADDFVSGVEYKMLLSKLEQLRSNVASVEKDLKQSEKNVAQVYATAIEDIRKFRQEVEEYLDQMEQCMTKECDRLKRVNVEGIKNIKDDLQSFKNELDGISDRLTLGSKQTGDLFVQANRTSLRLIKLEQEMKRETKHALKYFEFERNKDVEDIVSKKSPFGKLVSKTSRSHLCGHTKIVDFTPVPAGEINVKSTRDTTTTYISSMLAMSRNTLLCVDRNNNSVKVVDTENGCICSQITLKSGPWDITPIPKDQVAVTLPDVNEIFILSLGEKELKVNSKMKVSGKCRGIAYTNNTLVVSYEDSTRLEIMGLFGDVLKTIKLGNKSDNLLDWPGSVDVGIYGDCIFVSDLQRNSVIKVTFDGRLIGTYKDADLKYPRALTVCRDGSVLVCSSGGHTVHLISPDCRKVKILLTKDDAMYAQSAFYNEVTATLYLYSCDETGFTDRTDYGVIRVYKNKA